MTPVNTEEVQDTSKKMQYFWVVVLLLISFSAILKLPTFNLPHNEGDEVRFWYLTKNWIETGHYTLQGSPLLRVPAYLGTNRKMPVHPPLFPTLLRPFAQHNALNKAVMASWLGHFLAILAVALMGRYLFLYYGLTLSALSPLFWLPLLGIATDPIMTWISGILWIDNLHAGLAALSIALAMMANQAYRPKLMYFFSGVILGLALLSKVTPAMIIPLLFYIIVVGETDNKKRIQALLLGAIPALLLASLWYVPLYLTMGELIFPKTPVEIQAMLDNLSPQALQAFEQASYCGFCQMAINSPWYYQWPKLSLISPLFLVGISFSFLFYILYIRTLEVVKRGHFLIPLFWCLGVLSILTYLQLMIMRRTTLLIASLYVMFYMLIVFSEKYQPLKKYQPLLLLLGAVSIVYSAIGGGYYLFKGNYAEIFSMPELAGFIKLWGAEQ